MAQRRLTQGVVSDRGEQDRERRVAGIPPAGVGSLILGGSWACWFPGWRWAAGTKVLGSVSTVRLGRHDEPFMVGVVRLFCMCWILPARAAARARRAR